MRKSRVVAVRCPDYKIENLSLSLEKLVDFFSCAPPHLTIMDAVVRMEGEDPSAGVPKKIGLILGSTDAVALDAVATRIAGYEPGRIFTTY